MKEPERWPGTCEVPGQDNRSEESNQPTRCPPVTTDTVERRGLTVMAQSLFWLWGGPSGFTITSLRWTYSQSPCSIAFRLIRAFSAILMIRGPKGPVGKALPNSSFQPFLLP